MRAAQKALGIKAPVPVALAARRHVDAVAAAQRRPPAPPTSPDRLAGPAQTPGPAARTSPQRTRPATAPRRGRRVALRPASAAICIAAALVASSGGYAAGHFVGGDRRAAASPPAPATTAATQRASYLRSVDGVMQRLSAQRATARRDLRAARRARAQAASATALADAYRAAREAIPAGGAAGSADASLVPELRGAERAYRALAAAARQESPRAFRAAGQTVLRAESELARALGRIQQI